MKKWGWFVVILFAVVLAVFMLKPSKNAILNEKRDKIRQYILQKKLVGEERAYVINSLKSGLTEFNGWKEDATVAKGNSNKQRLFLVVPEVTSSFDLKDGPASWDVALVLYFNAENRLEKYEVVYLPTRM